MNHKTILLVCAFSILSTVTKAQTDTSQTASKTAKEKQKEQAAKADVYIANKSIGISDEPVNVESAKKPVVKNSKAYKQKNRKKHCMRKYTNKSGS